MPNMRHHQQQQMHSQLTMTDPRNTSLRRDDKYVMIDSLEPRKAAKLQQSRQRSLNQDLQDDSVLPRQQSPNTGLDKSDILVDFKEDNQQTFHPRSHV